MAGSFLAGTSTSFAQSIYCPANTSSFPLGNGEQPTQGSLNYSNGTCTNGANGVGAFSGAALASQALSDLTQSVTTQENTVTSETIRERRRTEVEACSPGLERINGACIRRTPVVAPRAARVTQRIERTRTGTRRVVVRQPAPVEAAPAPVIMLSAPRFGAWAQAYGDYERRSGTGVSSISYIDNNTGNTLTSSLYIRAKSESRTGGVMAGFDVTTRGLFNADDGFIGGILAGYTQSYATVNTTIIPGDTTLVPVGVSRFKADLNGPTIGVYGTYFSGGFSADMTAKVAFYNVGISFNETLGFTGNNATGNGGWLYSVGVPFAGRGSTDLVQGSLVGNINYKFPLSATWWIEPTAGIQWVHQGYSGGAASLGLADGDLVRIQGGARVGTDMLFGSTPVNFAMTALVYSNVALSGGFVQLGTAGPGARVLNDEGLVRGQGSLKVSMKHGGGWQSYVQADVYGGERLFGTAGKLGVRYEW